MPYSATWVLHLETPPSLEPVSPALPPALGGASPCGHEHFDLAHLLRVLDRAYPGDYVAGLKQRPDGGYELFAAAARATERVSLAAARLYCNSFLGSAHGGARSAGSVEFYRLSGGAEAAARRGTLLRASRSGRLFRTLVDAVFGPADLGPVVVAVEAVAPGYEYDLPGQGLTAAGELLDGEIDEVWRASPYATAADLDAPLLVRQVAPTAGGSAPGLDAYGEDRAVPRLAGEPDDAYRVRIADAPDTVSPAAIARGADKLLRPHGAGVCLREVGTPKLPGFFYDAGGSASPVQDPARDFPYDLDFEAHPEHRFKLYLDALHFRAYVMVGVPPVAHAGFGMPYDAPPGVRAAYDTTDERAENAYDGHSVYDAALYRAIYDMVVQKKAAGVSFDLYLEAIGCS